MNRKSLIFGLFGMLALVGLVSSANAQPALNTGMRPDWRMRTVALRVFNVVPGSPAANVGFEPGDIIVTVNGQPVSSLADLNLALSQSGRVAQLDVLDAWTGMPTRVWIRPINGRIGVFVTPVPVNNFRPWNPIFGMDKPQITGEERQLHRGGAKLQKP